ncbi:MAG: DUF3179 domain-containing protein [Pseudomonadota bacterium]
MTDFPLTRRRFGALAAAASFGPALPALAQAEDPLLQAQLSLIYPGSREEFDDALALIVARADRDMAAGLIRAHRFSRGQQHLINAALQSITGETIGSWFDWMLWQEANPEITPHPSYIEFTRRVLLDIDPNWAVFLEPETLSPEAMDIRLEEVTWGGVFLDGIPSLDNPELIGATEAEYMRGDDLVFGVSINGDARAYPLRIMGWHEMFNDVIGGVPVALAYCTLCGAGILFETQLEGRAEPLIFGSSGFLYRSNKLMFDRETHSLWNQFTGAPVQGPLRGSGVQLRERPIVIDSWANWRAAEPATRILSLNTGHDRDYGSGVVYRDYFASPRLMFPALADEGLHAVKDYVFGIRQFGGAKAWPLDAFAGGAVINDALQDRALVLIGDAETRTIRAYERGEATFTADGVALVDQDGATWQIGAEALTAQDGATLPRVAGHIAYWFAWNNYLGAETELYAVE